MKYIRVYENIDIALEHKRFTIVMQKTTSGVKLRVECDKIEMIGNVLARTVTLMPNEVRFGNYETEEEAIEQKTDLEESRHYLNSLFDQVKSEAPVLNCVEDSIDNCVAQIVYRVNLNEFGKLKILEDEIWCLGDGCEKPSYVVHRYTEEGITVFTSCSRSECERKIALKEWVVDRCELDACGSVITINNLVNSDGGSVTYKCPKCLSLVSKSRHDLLINKLSKSSNFN